MYCEVQNGAATLRRPITIGLSPLLTSTAAAVAVLFAGGCNLLLVAARRTWECARRWACRTHRDGLQSSTLPAELARGRFDRAGRGGGGGGGAFMKEGGWPAMPGGADVRGLYCALVAVWQY